jgi:hypothetical protein
MAARSREALSAMSKDELIALLLAPDDTAPGDDVPSAKRYKAAPAAAAVSGDAAIAPPMQAAKIPRAFDWSRHCQRHIALRVAYLGGRYSGFMVRI